MAPPNRTRVGQGVFGQLVEGMQVAVANKSKPAKALTKLTSDTGVTGVCPLLRLQYFDPVRDAPIDMMHTLHNNVQRIIKTISQQKHLGVSNADLNAAHQAQEGQTDQPDENDKFTYVDVCDYQDAPPAYLVLWSDDSVTWVNRKSLRRDVIASEGRYDNAITQYERRQASLQVMDVGDCAPNRSKYVDVIGHRSNDHGRSHYLVLLADGSVAWDHVNKDSHALNIDVICKYERRTAIQQPIPRRHGTFTRATEPIEIKQSELDAADKRLDSIPQSPSLLPWSCRSPFTTQAGRMKMHDSLVWCEHWAAYHTAGLLPKDGERILLQYFDFLRRLVARSIRHSEIDSLERQSGIVLSELELVLPATEFTILVHVLHHIPAQLRWFGPARCTWMFSFERSITRRGKGQSVM